MNLYRKAGKRILDIVFSLLALLLLSPLLLGISTVCAVSQGLPILFRQTRVGLNEELFTMKKFRTMREGDAPDEERVTKVGRFLRKTSLDELPELVSVLKGDMSLIGPRPLLVEYLPLYNERQHRRHEVRGGMTGLAQLLGRNDLRFEDRFSADVYYVDNLSFSLDIWIFFNTIKLLLNRKEIKKNDKTSNERFFGTDEKMNISQSTIIEENDK